MVIANYVYDKVGAKRKKVIHYDNVFPVEQMFGWDDIGKFQNRPVYTHAFCYIQDTAFKRLCVTAS